MAKKFFSYDPEDGLALHDTEEEAKVRAQSAIDLYREDAHEGWAEEVDRVCWGEVKQQAKEIDTTAETRLGFETCDYQLADA